VETKKEYDRQKSLEKQGATSKRAVETARANWVSYVNQKADAEARLLQMQASLSEAKANLAKAKADLGAPGDQNAQVRQAKAEIRSAELNLEFTQKKAPVDGYVTNLNLRLGSQAVENQAILALVDVNSYWVVGFFKENYIEGIRKGDRAVLTLMSYRDKPIEGSVDSLGWGIAQDDGSTGFDMLPTISATFEWIRLAQRVPVRIHLAKIPEGVALRVGTTVSVLVMTGTSGSESKIAAVAAPRALQ
jgi:multidrug resistance efflux pump